MSKLVKLRFSEQITHFESKGIEFKRISEDEALLYLKEKNNFFRMKSYCKNFEYNIKNQIYIDLDFAYLKDLATIDMYLRRLLLSITIMIEHYLKMELISTITDDDGEDGTNIAYIFLKQNPNYRGILEKNFSSFGSGEIYNKYKDKLAVWHLVELLTFGQFTELYRLYFKMKATKNGKLAYLNSVKKIRNACAHDVCLLNSIKNPYKVYKYDSSSSTLSETVLYKNSQLTSFISRLGLKKGTRKNQLDNPLIHDSLSVILLFFIICNESKTKKQIIDQLEELFNKRMTRNKEYYQKNSHIKSSFTFTSSVVNGIINAYR